MILFYQNVCPNFSILSSKLFSIYLLVESSFRGNGVGGGGAAVSSVIKQELSDQNSYTFGVSD